jgi:predicted ATPase
LFVRGTPPESSYLFKHALVLDAAYGTLLRGRRQRLHARIAMSTSALSDGAAITEFDVLPGSASRLL